MIFLRSRYWFLTFLPLLAVIFPTTAAKASGDFETSYEVTYTIEEDGAATVHQRISLTNLTKDFYASEHELNVGRAKVENVWAQDPGGSLSPELLEVEGDRVIRVVFGSPVVGEGEVLRWELGYQTDVAERRGKVWRVDLPGVEGEPGLVSYKVFLEVPQSFGKPAFISPSPARSGENSGKYWFEFEGLELMGGGIRVGFGDLQVFDLDLNFRLKNSRCEKVYLDIPIPPDIRDRQQIIFKGFSPAPEEVWVDGDGNYLARFLFLPEEEKAIRFLGTGLVYPFLEDPSLMMGKVSDIPEELLQKYTGGQRFWEVDDGDIQAKVQDLVADQVTVFEKVRSIYDYVAAHLSYNDSQPGQDVERLGALQAFKERDRVLCTEYADLFVTLARAAGIPARVLEGYALSADESFLSGKDALHAWAEVYLPGLNLDDEGSSPSSPRGLGTTEDIPRGAKNEGGWWPVDPTWGSTTGGSDYLKQLDLAHLVFVKKGLDSISPGVVGFSEEDGGMSVSLAELVRNMEPKLNIEVELSESGLSGWPREGVLTVMNRAQVTAFDVGVKFVTEGVGFGGERVVDLGDLPPWAEKTVEFKVSAGIFNEIRSAVEVGVGWEGFSGKRVGEVVTTEATFLPFWRYIFSRWALLPVGIGFLVIGFYILRRRF